ncbi:MAG: type II secretion system F family protein [Caldisericia bacterium]|nr:type II secretion system F family protein [Caldisericia bacterium]
MKTGNSSRQNKKDDLFSPYYQSKKRKNTINEGNKNVSVKEGSLSDIFQTTISTFALALMIVGGLACVFVVFYIMYHNIIMGILFSGIAAAGFLMFLQIKKTEKENKFVNQLPDTLSAVANSLKAGFSLDQAFEFVSISMPEPTKSEFSRIHLNYRVGLTLSTSLEDLLKKYPNPEVKLFVSSMVLQEQIGGNVVPFLGELKNILKERVKLKGSIAVGTAQTRLSSAIVALLPYVMLMLLVSSGYDSLTNTLKGILLLIFAILMQATGLFINDKITKVDV